MTLERYFVAIDRSGEPIAQRTTIRAVPPQSANARGQFSVKPPGKSHPLKVVEVPKPVEWVATATLLGSNTKVSQRSRSGRPGQNYLLYRYTIRGTNERHETVVWTDARREDYAAAHPDVEVVAYAAGKVEIRNWPPRLPNVFA